MLLPVERLLFRYNRTEEGVALNKWRKDAVTNVQAISHVALPEHMQVLIRELRSMLASKQPRELQIVLQRATTDNPKFAQWRLGSGGKQTGKHIVAGVLAQLRAEARVGLKAFAEAESEYKTSIEHMRTANNAKGVSASYRLIGELQNEQGNFEQAATAFEQAAKEYTAVPFFNWKNLELAGNAALKVARADEKSGSSTKLERLQRARALFERSLDAATLHLRSAGVNSTSDIEAGMKKTAASLKEVCDEIDIATRAAAAAAAELTIDG